MTVGAPGQGPGRRCGFEPLSSPGWEPGPYTDENHDQARRLRRERGGQMEATATPPAPQHMRALARANRVRLARAELKRQVAEGEVSVAEVVLSVPFEAESMAIGDLLLSQRRWGQTRCRRFLASIP